MKTMLDASEMTKLLAAEYPQLLETGERSYRIEAALPSYGRLRLIYSPRHLRPGGTRPLDVHAGDLPADATILGQIGAVPLAVTTSTTIDFFTQA